MAWALLQKNTLWSYCKTQTVWQMGVDQAAYVRSLKKNSEHARRGSSTLERSRHLAAEKSPLPFPDCVQPNPAAKGEGPHAHDRKTMNRHHWRNDSHWKAPSLPTKKSSLHWQLVATANANTHHKTMPRQPQCLPHWRWLWLCPWASSFSNRHLDFHHLG